MVRHCAFRWAIILAAFAGCRSTSPKNVQPPPMAPATISATKSIVAPSPATALRIEQVSHQESLPAPSPEMPPPVSTGGNDGELSLDELLAAVESRNASLEAMLAAWQAASQKYPQAIALDDPMFMAMGAPASFGSPDVESAYVLELKQRIPWHGKPPLCEEQ